MRPANAQTADFDVAIDGRLLDKETVVGITVHRDVSAPAVFELRLKNRKRTARSEIILSEDSRFSVERPVEIKMGTVGRLERVLAGEITGLELEFRTGGETLTVRGHDRGHRLMRGQKTRSFTQTKDSDIAKQVARDAGLSAKVEDTAVMLEYVLQHNQTDWEFLQQRAQSLGYEVLIDNQTLLFRSHKNDGAEVLTLTRETHGLEFRPRLSAVGLVGEVIVQGWSPKERAAITGKASAGDEKNLMGGRNGGLKTADTAFGKAVGALVDRPVFSRAEAEQIALSRLKEMALAYVAGEGVMAGRSDLKAGTVIKIEGFGTRFSGRYYLTSVCHTLVPKHGYRTAFTVRRNAT